jgi:hypothetical protein
VSEQGSRAVWLKTDEHRKGKVKCCVVFGIIRAWDVDGGYRWDTTRLMSKCRNKSDPDPSSPRED